MPEVSFGEWLKRRRGAEGWTQGQLAQKINCSVSALRKMESEERRPSADTIERLAALFRIPQDERKSFLRFARGDWQAISEGDREDSPWLISPGRVTKHIETSPPKNNLPLQLTNFIGREKDKAEILNLLAGQRLVTLVGAGGIGKTRLSLEVAREALITFPDGLWFIELAPVSDPALVSQAIVNTLGLIEQANRSFQTILTDFLRKKKALLIFDNCEHLIQACAQLTEALLRACSNLKILATSREALGISGEFACNVDTLSIPDIRQSLRAESLTEYESVRLFLDRAQTTVRNFTITSDNLHAIAQICHHLDGIPLALELAAARVKGLSVEQIASRLDDRFHLLSSGNRTALSRHQTLQALIDWSHDLLTEPEQMLLSRLSVFAGGWTLESAERICAGDGLESNQILALLLRLVDKSLVTAKTQEAESRYHMLETIRQYAHEKLWQAGEGEWMRERHLVYFVDLAERAEPNLRAFDMLMWLDRLETELENIRVALEWAQESDIEAQLRLASALLWFWHIRNYKSEGTEWLERALTIKTTEPDDQPMTPHRALIRGKALHAAGFLSLMFMETEKGSLLSEEALSLFQALGMAGRPGMAYTLCNLSVAASQKQDFLRQKTFLERSFEMFQELGDKFGIAQCLNDLGYFAIDDGEYEQAKTLWEDHLALRKEIGDMDGIALALCQLGRLANQQGNYNQAATYFETSLSLFRQLRNKWAMGMVLDNLACLAGAQGNYSQAAENLEEALGHMQALGNKFFLADTLSKMGALARSQGNYARATQLHEEALTLFRELGNKIDIAYALSNSGFTAIAKEDDEQAENRFDEALLISQDITDKLLAALALYGLGRVAQARGNYTHAQARYTEGIMSQSSKLIVAKHLEGFALLATIENHMERAVKLFGASHTLHSPFRFEMSAKERAEHDQAIDVARATLGEETFTTAWDEGKKMTLDDVIRYALEES